MAPFDHPRPAGARPPGGRDDLTWGYVAFGAACAIVVVLGVFLASCRPQRPACGAKTLAAIESAYVAEVVSTCAGKTMKTCPELPAIETKYRTMREEWIQCR